MNRDDIEQLSQMTGIPFDEIQKKMAKAGLQDEGLLEKARRRKPPSGGSLIPGLGGEPPTDPPTPEAESAPDAPKNTVFGLRVHTGSIGRAVALQRILQGLDGVSDVRSIGWSGGTGLFNISTSGSYADVSAAVSELIKNHEIFSKGKFEITETPHDSRGLASQRRVTSIAGTPPPEPPQPPSSGSPSSGSPSSGPPPSGPPPSGPPPSGSPSQGPSQPPPRGPSPGFDEESSYSDREVKGQRPWFGNSRSLFHRIMRWVLWKITGQKGPNKTSDEEVLNASENMSTPPRKTEAQTPQSPMNRGGSVTPVNRGGSVTPLLPDSQKVRRRGVDIGDLGKSITENQLVMAIRYLSFRKSYGQLMPTIYLSKSLVDEIQHEFSVTTHELMEEFKDNNIEIKVKE